MFYLGQFFSLKMLEKKTVKEEENPFFHSNSPEWSFHYLLQLKKLLFFLHFVPNG